MKNLILIAVGSLLLTGCLTTRSALNVGAVQPKTEVDVLREQKTDALMQLTSIDEQLRALNGRMEVLESHAQQGSVASGGGINNSQFKRLEERFDILRKAVDELDRKVNGKKSGSLAVNNSTRVAKKTPKATARKSLKVNRPTVKKPMLKKENPVVKIHKRVFDQAEADFKNNNFIKSIDGYQKYRELNPNGLRYAKATYNMGIAFTKLGFEEESKVFFKEVADSHQSSPLAKMAKARLD